MVSFFVSCKSIFKKNIYASAVGGHYQAAWRRQWFASLPNSDGTDVNVILRFTRATQPVLITSFF